MKIILCGYMGSGKSKLGRLLASKLEIPFADLDNEIEKNNLKIPEIFSEKGEIFFRKTENKVLKELLSDNKNQILALGGGTPCYANNLEIIKKTPNAKLIYLEVALEELTKRLFLEKNRRPLLKRIDSEADLKDFIRKHLFERTYYYRQSDWIINANAKPEEVVATIESRLA